MKYIWRNYNSDTMRFVEEWLDDEAIEKTGIEDGWQDFYEYWLNDSNTVYGENYWCKVVFEKETPFAVIALSINDGAYNIMELIIKPEERNKGKGTMIIKELLNHGKEIIGKDIYDAEAVIYPSNPASQQAFKKAGFELDRAHEDGDVLYYRYINK